MPLTGTGLALLPTRMPGAAPPNGRPLPRAPLTSPPQHFTSPVVSTAHVVLAPVLTITALSTPGTGCGERFAGPVERSTVPEFAVRLGTPSSTPAHSTPSCSWQSWLPQRLAPKLARATTAAGNRPSSPSRGHTARRRSAHWRSPLRLDGLLHKHTGRGSVRDSSFLGHSPSLKWPCHTRTGRGSAHKIRDPENDVRTLGRPQGSITPELAGLRSTGEPCVLQCSPQARFVPGAASSCPHVNR